MIGPGLTTDPELIDGNIALCALATVHGPSILELAESPWNERARRDQEAGARKAAMKQPLLGPALAVNSQVPGTGIGIPDG